MVYYVLYSDGTWSGGFQFRHEAEEQVEAYGGQIVEGKWFDTEIESKEAETQKAPPTE